MFKLHGKRENEGVLFQASKTVGLCDATIEVKCRGIHSRGDQLHPEMRGEVSEGETSVSEQSVLQVARPH